MNSGGIRASLPSETPVSSHNALDDAEVLRERGVMELQPQAIPAAFVRAQRPERQHGILPEPLYVCGELATLAAPTVAIVGTRAPSELGRLLARSIASDLGRSGIGIISGLARGIDAAAHEGALAVGALTIGVLAGGHQRFYPREHLALGLAMIAAGGAVVSPFPPTAPPYPQRFLSRNGIIIALADALVVIEAPRRSGALNSASWAADAGIPVLVVPGDVDRPKVAGCLELIRDGATLIRDASDIREALGFASPTNQPRAAGKPSPTLELPFLNEAGPQSDRVLLFKALEDGPASIETLAHRTELPVTTVIRLTTMLNLDNMLLELSDGRFALEHQFGKGSR